MPDPTTAPYQPLSQEDAKPGEVRIEQLEMGAEIKPEGRKYDAAAQYIALGGILMCAAVTWTVVLFSSAPYSWFTIHPPLQTLGLVMITYAVLTLQPTSQPVTKEAGLRRHKMAILGVAVPTLLVGTFGVAYNKSLNGHKHFHSWHGILGAMCVGWMVVQILIGGLSVWFGGAAFGGGAKAKAVWKYHRLSGYVLFPLLLLTAYLGGSWSHWAQKNIHFTVSLIGYAIPLSVVVVAVYTRMRTSKMKFF